MRLGGPVAAAGAPIIAVTYSAPEFVTWDTASPWQFALRAVVAAGGVPLAIDCSTEQPNLATLIGLSDGLIVLGGGDIDPRQYDGDPDDPSLGGVNPTRDAAEITAFGVADALDLPTLAICRGFQLLNAARGGSIIVDLPRDRPGSVDHQPGMAALMDVQHDVLLARESRPATWMGATTVSVNSEHHQGIAEAGAGLLVTACAPDGLIEAVETPDGRVVGVQWHPEMLWSKDASALALLSGFVSECRAAANS